MNDEQRHEQEHELAQWNLSNEIRQAARESEPRPNAKLLITGSRKASDQMIFTAFKAVQRAKERQWEIIVGDARGVDEAVIRECETLGVIYDCYGITEAPRAPRCSLSAYHRVATDFLARDRYMADLADCCLAIWDGSSRGTIYTYSYFKKSGKECWLIDFSKKKGNTR